MKKKFILLSLVIINTFALIGCGQSKEEVKNQVKQELKSETTSKQDSEIKEKTGVSKSDFEKFLAKYKQYSELLNKAYLVVMPEEDSTRITAEQSIQYMNDAKLIRDEVVKLVPNKLLNDFNEYDNATYNCLELLQANPPLNGTKTEEQKNAIDKKSSCVFNREIMELTNESNK